jgi:hypothetical protein
MLSSSTAERGTRLLGERARRIELVIEIVPLSCPRPPFKEQPPSTTGRKEKETKRGDRGAPRRREGEYLIGGIGWREEAGIAFPSHASCQVDSPRGHKGDRTNNWLVGCTGRAVPLRPENLAQGPLCEGHSIHSDRVARRSLGRSFGRNFGKATRETRLALATNARTERSERISLDTRSVDSIHPPSPSFSEGEKGTFSPRNMRLPSPFFFLPPRE